MQLIAINVKSSINPIKYAVDLSRKGKDNLHENNLKKN